SYLLILVALISYTAFGQQTVASGMKSKVFNYTSFTFNNKNISPLLKELTPLKYQSNPDFGILPYDAPNQSYLELVQKRTLHSRYYVKVTPGQTDTTIAIQQSLNEENYYDSTSHFIRAVDPRLKPFSYSQKIFIAPNQEYPTKIDIGNQFVSISSSGKEFQFSRKLQLLHKDTLGTITNLGLANWSNYSVGDDGAMIYSIWPSIDMKINVNNGNIETSFLINNSLSYSSGWLIIRDSLNIPTDLTAHFTNGYTNTNNQWVGNINFVSSNDSTQYIFYKAETSDQTFNVLNSYQSGYVFNNNTLDIYTPLSFINSPNRQYPVVIDPTVTNTGTLLQASVSGADKNDNGGFGCANTIAVPAPIQCTITDVQFYTPFQSVFNYDVCGRNSGIYAGTIIKLGSCTSPGTAPASIYGCNSHNLPCNCVGTLDVYSDLKTCLPAPSCTAFNINFLIYFWTSNNTSPCSTNNFIASDNWTVTVYGQTVAQPAAPTSSAGTTLCHSTPTSLQATGNYGVPVYTYSWSPATGLSSTTTNPTTAAISATTTYTCTITDACGQTATQSITLTYATCLPIQLLNFNAQYNAISNSTNLNWATASETNNNYFTVERTLDGINYTPIDTVKGANNSTQTLHYAGIDHNPVLGVDYYRLKQTDFDGNYTYSDVVAVNVNASGKANLSVIPNPAGNEASIRFISPVIGTSILNIYDYTGRLIKTEQIATNMGTNTLPLDVSNYTNGIYFISLNNGIQVYSSKLVVNH
ncbi:MAG: T9SS type A sorting domain-containing protein, partial [Bacteroidia bacterium]